MISKLREILVVSDVDGTLLQAGFGVPKENIDTIEKFTSLGGHFTVATGRGIASVGRYTDYLKLSAPAILVNGGIIYDYSTGKILYESILDTGARILLSEIMNVFPNMGVEILQRENIIALRMNEEVHYHTALEHIPVTLTDIKTVGDGWNKVLFADKKEKILELKHYVDKKKKHDERYSKYEFVQTSNIYYELIPLGTNKANGLKKLTELTDISMNNTVAIGDFYNDLELFSVAGLSAVVSDAPDDIKKKADIVVKSCLAGGVADLLNRLIDKYYSEL